MTTFNDWQSELRHYGVLGMKWGIRKDPHAAYEKASAKKRKLDMAANASKSTMISKPSGAPTLLRWSTGSGT